MWLFNVIINNLWWQMWCLGNMVTCIDVNDLCACTAGGSHTLSKTVTTSSVGGLSGFVKKKSSCISCKAPLSDNSWVDDMCNCVCCGVR